MQTDPEEPSCFRRLLNWIFGSPSKVEQISPMVAVAPVADVQTLPENDTEHLTV
jgi:hypothetical protein